MANPRPCENELPNMSQLFLSKLNLCKNESILMIFKRTCQRANNI